MKIKFIHLKIKKKNQILQLKINTLVERFISYGAGSADGKRPHEEFRMILLSFTYLSNSLCFRGS